MAGRASDLARDYDQGMKPSESPRRLGIALTLGAVLVLTGCSGTAEPVPSETPGATATPVLTAAPLPPAPSSPTLSPGQDPLPALPPLRDMVTEPPGPGMTNDEPGAVAFLHYYVDAMNWAYASGDPSLLESICAPENVHCAEAISAAQLLARQDLTQHGGSGWLYSMRDAVITQPEPDLWIIQTQLHVALLDVRSPGGKIVRTADEQEMTLAFKMRWMGENWQMLEAVKVD